MSSTLALTRPAPVVTEPSRDTATRRDPWFDNAKMLLVTLVVVGHSWTLLPDNRLGNWLYDFLYLWHVPAFVMVTGYLSRNFTWTRSNLRRLVTTVAVPYLIFEGALAGFRVFVGGEDLDLVFADPHWPMWYLAVLFLWRLATPVLKAMPWSVPVAVAVSLAGGLATAEVLDSSRAMGLLPFFVIGLLAQREHLDLLRAPRTRRTAVGVLAAVFGLASLVEGHLRTEWLYWRSGYAEMEVTFLQGAAVRAGLLVVATAAALSFLALLPRTGGWFTRLGVATLVVYLFHGFAVKAAYYAGATEWTSAHPVLGLFATTGAAVVLALVLAAPPVARRLNVLVDPVGASPRHRPARPQPPPPVRQAD